MERPIQLSLNLHESLVKENAQGLVNVSCRQAFEIKKKVMHEKYLFQRESVRLHPIA